MPKGIKYTDEFKREAVKLVHGSGKSVKQIATELGIKSKTLSYWVKSSMILVQGATPKSPHHYQELLAENQRLRQELKRTQQEREILKKAAAYFASLEK
jgi:transposase